MYDLRLSVALLVLVVSTMSGCAGPTAQDPTILADSKSALNYEKSDWKRPFWEGPDAPADGAETPQAVPDEGRPRANVGLIVTPGLTDTADIPAMLEDVRRQAPAHGMWPIPTGVLQDALAQAPACRPSPGPVCADQLASYPGIRLLVQLSGGAADDTVRVRMHDTVLGHSHPELTLSLNADTPALLLENMARRVELAPWSTRAFTGSDGNLYIGAGLRHGLTTGTWLAVHESGTVVKAPSVQVVAWRPGPTVGRVRVTEMLGDSMAVVEHESGEMPTPEHRLMLEASAGSNNVSEGR